MITPNFLMNEAMFIIWDVELPNGRLHPRREAQRSGVGYKPWFDAWSVGMKTLS
jgi:hypothetical protein